MNVDNKAIEDVLAGIIDAYRSRDADRAMAPYASDDELVVFDIAPPPGALGFSESLERTHEFMAITMGPVELAWGNVRILSADDLAAMHGELTMTATTRDGAAIEVRGRTTIVLRRSEGTWRIVHEHDSIPAAMV